ncbi:hypothetical protein RJT34_23854 [Clitoria ternatea]|uniref:Uncharacterized protein n=1 Tax=Clitoria ternatea TaxID=43366 RepID=A0AAN9IL52_CLITE
MRVTQVLCTAVILGLLWWQSDTKNPKDLQDQAGLLVAYFMAALRLSVGPFFLTILTVFLCIVAAQECISNHYF